MVYTSSNPKYVIEKDTATAIANSIRSRAGKTGNIDLKDFASEISAIDRNKLPTPSLSELHNIESEDSEGDSLTITVPYGSLDAINVGKNQVSAVLYFQDYSDSSNIITQSVSTVTEPCKLSELELPNGMYYVQAVLKADEIIDSEPSNTVEYIRQISEVESDG